MGAYVDVVNNGRCATQRRLLMVKISLKMVEELQELGALVIRESKIYQQIEGI